MFLLQRLGLISGQERRFHKWFVLALVSEVAQLCPTTWTVAYQAPLSIGFSRQEYWNGLPFPSPGDLPDPGIEPGSPTLQADSLPSELSFIEFLLYAKLSIYVIFHLTIHTTISKMRTRKLRNSADVIKVIYLRGQAGIQA